jgi:hypothetical protein
MVNDQLFSAVSRVRRSAAGCRPFSFWCLRPLPRTSFHHQPEAQHPRSSAIHKLGCWVIRGHHTRHCDVCFARRGDIGSAAGYVRYVPLTD